MKKVNHICILISLFLLIPGFLSGFWKFNSFEGDPYWMNSQVDREIDLYEGDVAIISYQSGEVFAGEAALQIDYYALGGRGAYLAHMHMDSLSVYDFSGYDSLVFWYYNDLAQSEEGAVHMRFNLCEVSDSQNGVKTYDIAETEYWYTFHYILDDPPGWNKIAIPLVDVRNDPHDNGFELTGWYGIEGNDTLDLDMIKGFQIEFDYWGGEEGNVVTGSILLDELILLSTSGDTMVVNSFDGDPYWKLSQVDREEQLDGEAIISYESGEVKGGEAAMRIDYFAVGGGGAYLPHLKFDSLGVYDFSDYDSLIFWYYNDLAQSEEGAVHMRFNLCDVSDSPNGFNTYDIAQTEYWYSFHYILDDPPGWNKIAIPLADDRIDPNGNGFELTGWHGISGNDELDLDMIKGFQIEFDYWDGEEGHVVSGSIILDELVLLSEGETPVETIPFSQPIDFKLAQNYPNPFNASTRIEFTIREANFVQLDLYDALGRKIKNLVNKKMTGGKHTVTINVSDLASGVYFYQIQAGDFHDIKKMILLK